MKSWAVRESAPSTHCVALSHWQVDGGTDRVKALVPTGPELGCGLALSSSVTLDEKLG